MDHFQHQEHRLHAEEVPVAHIAERFGTPCYVYSPRHPGAPLAGLHTALRPSTPPDLAPWSNSDGVLNVLARLGSGFGEHRLQR